MGYDILKRGYRYVFFFNNDNLKKYLDSRENRDAIVIIPSGLEIFRSQNTKDSKNSHYYTFFPKLKHSLAKIVNLSFSV